MEVLLDFALKLVNEYGLSVTFLILYPITLIYVMVLRHKEQQRTLQVINDTIKSNNQLREEVQQFMRHSNSIIAACIYALGGNKEEAKSILSSVNNCSTDQEGE